MDFTHLIGVCRDTLGYTPYPVQLQGAEHLYNGKLIEMNTGEGKTLTAIFPAAKHALEGKKVHILTFNDHLAKRDANWMRPFYEALNLKVGFITSKMSHEERKQGYKNDVLYVTAKEVGFDYLKSFIAYDQEEIILPELDYAIIDEADTILIDEARNPLVMAGDLYQEHPDLLQISRIIAEMNKGTDFSLDDYGRNVFLNDAGIKLVESKLNLENLYDQKNQLILSAINLSLQAHSLLIKDRDYVVKNSFVLLVDEFTGRIVKDRKWQHGLQMAVEIKENITPQNEGVMLGSTTLPAFLKKYSKIAAMTATATESKDEFRELYRLKIETVHPNIPCQRIDLPDQVFTHKEAKYIALAEEISDVNKTGRPVLIGTLSVKESEELAAFLSEKELSPRVLNANNDEQEAEIIAEAGDLGALTISTNMAGRGIDIILGGSNGANRDKVLALGGLHVIGTNRHESRRIDNQLRGRSGRQGDPGSSQFFISMEDDLMLKYNLQSILPKKLKGLKQESAYNNKTLVKRIAQAQRIIEGQMQDLRKTLSDYTLIIEQQRNMYQSDRQSWLSSDHLSKDLIINLFDQQWAIFLDYSHEVKEGIYLLRLGGDKPLRKFNRMMDQRFHLLLNDTNEKVEQIKRNPDEFLENSSIKKPSSTWNYLVNDSPFQNQFAINLLT